MSTLRTQSFHWSCKRSCRRISFGWSRLLRWWKPFVRCLQYRIFTRAYLQAQQQKRTKTHHLNSWKHKISIWIKNSFYSIKFSFIFISLFNITNVDFEAGCLFRRFIRSRDSRFAYKPWFHLWIKARIKGKRFQLLQNIWLIFVKVLTDRNNLKCESVLQSAQQ